MEDVFGRGYNLPGGLRQIRTNLSEGSWQIRTYLLGGFWYSLYFANSHACTHVDLTLVGVPIENGEF